MMPLTSLAYMALKEQRAFMEEFGNTTTDDTCEIEAFVEDIHHTGRYDKSLLQTIFLEFARINSLAPPNPFPDIWRFETISNLVN